MYRTMATFLTLALMLCASMLVPGQNNPSLPDKLERTVKEKEPDWKLETKHVRKNSEEDNSLHQWRSGAQAVTVSISNTASLDQAARDLERSVHSVAIGKPTLLPDIGDEAYIWVGDAKGWGAVHFRKGTTVVIVNGPSAAVARRFARHAADQIVSN